MGRMQKKGRDLLPPASPAVLLVPWLRTREVFFSCEIPLPEGTSPDCTTPCLTLSLAPGDSWSRDGETQLLQWWERMADVHLAEGTHGKPMPSL